VLHHRAAALALVALDALAALHAVAALGVVGGLCALHNHCRAEETEDCTGGQSAERRTLHRCSSLVLGARIAGSACSDAAPEPAVTIAPLAGAYGIRGAQSAGSPSAAGGRCRKRLVAGAAPHPQGAARRPRRAHDGPG